MRNLTQLLQCRPQTNTILLAATEKHHKVPQFSHNGPEEYNPGLSIFKGKVINVSFNKFSNFYFHF